MPGARRGMLAAGRRAFDPAAIALFAAMTTQPDAARKKLISDTIVALKAAGVWSLLDVLYVMAAHDEQASRLNWKSPGNFTLATAGTITFEADRGWTGNGTNGYLNTNWTPATHAVNYTQNSASMGVYLRNHSGTTTRGLMGARNTSDSNTPRTSILFSTTSLVARLNVASATGQATATPAARLIVARRSSSTAQQIYIAAVEAGTGSTASDAVPQFPMYISALNNGADAVSFFDNRQYAYARAGAALSTAQMTAEYAILQNGYLAAVGAAI